MAKRASTAKKVAIEEESPQESIRRAVKKHAANVVPLVKARLIGPDTDTSNQIHPEDQDSAFTEAGALEPPYDPEMLTLLFEHSNALRQNVDSYATNIDGFGHILQPIIDLEDDEANERLTQALVAMGDVAPANDDALADERAKLRKQMIEERAKAQIFFDFCSQDVSFVRLRRQTRQDLEIMGNAYWEVLRDGDNEINEFVYVNSWTVRLLPLDRGLTSYKVKVKTSEISFSEVSRKKRFRRFVQIVENVIVFFKEFGDPRVLSSKSGNYYPSIEALEEAEEGVAPATELIHFKIHSPRSPYGVPRWIGALLAVVGSRQAEEVNFLYFENKSIPPMAVLVTGGKLGADGVKRLEEYIQTHIKGKKNFHKILVLEAEPIAGASAESIGKMRIQIVPLLGAQHTDQLFGKYIADNTDSIGGAFRLPRLLRGDIRDFNRSTADAALVFAERQVFEPERAEFDFLFNRHILPELGIATLKFRSLSPVARDPVQMAEMIRNLVNANVLTPEEGRALAEDVFNRAFKKVNKAWAKQPMPMTLAGMGELDESPTAPPELPQEAATPPKGGRGQTKKIAKRAVQEALHLVALRKVMKFAENELAREARDESIQDAREEDTIRLSRAEFEELVA
jgi:PBSX family phage portal protein